MTTRWEDLAARARGLATHLLGRAELEALARAPTFVDLTEALRARRFLPVEAGEPVTPDILELAVRRAAAARLATLARWARGRVAPLAIVFEDEDRRSLRALLRGAVQGAAPDERLAGLVPTPALPERALAELAAQPTPARIAALLVAWGNPYGPALLPEATATHPDLLTLEHALTRTFAARALRGARAARSRALTEFVRGTIDVENACSALALAGPPPDPAALRMFVEGGRRLSRAQFLDAVAAGDRGEAGHRLAAVFRPAQVAAVFERAVQDPGALDESIVRAQVADLAAAARRDPAGAASVLAFVLRQRAESLALRRAIWGRMLGAPPLVTA